MSAESYATGLLETKGRIRMAESNKSVMLACGTTQMRGHVQKLLRSFTRRGWGVSYVGWDRFTEMPKRDRSGSAEFRYIQRGWGSGGLNMALGVPLWSLRLLFVALFHRRTSLIYALDLDSAWACAVAATIRGIPLIYDVRDNYLLRHNWPRPLARILRALDNWTIRVAAQIVVVDENRVVGPLASHRDKIVVLHNCPEDIRPRPVCAGSDHCTILSTGHLSENRGIPFLLDALEALPDLRVLLAGRVVSQQLLERIENHPQVEFLEWVSQEEAWQLGWRAQAMFSCYAPTSPINLRAASNKWFDAMMAGIPVITNCEVERAEWVEAQDIGYVIPYGDIAALKQCLLVISGRPSKARRQGRKGRTLFERQYNWTAMESKLFDRIDGLFSVHH